MSPRGACGRRRRPVNPAKKQQGGGSSNKAETTAASGLDARHPANAEITPVPSHLRDAVIAAAAS